MEKQIFAALEIADHEIRLVLGEFFNTRFNVLKVEQVPCSGIQNLRIIQKDIVVETIKKTINNASTQLGASIESVLLSIPSKGARKVSMKVTVPIDSIDRKVTVLDVKNAVRKAMNAKLDDSLALVNIVCVRYTCNGITTRRIPLGEMCDSLTVQIDLLCADKNLTFDIVSCVEEAGCNVMDVSLDSYAIAKEACLFEQTVDQNVLLIKLEQQMTTMSLLYDGKLISCEVREEGFGDWIKELSNQVRLPRDISIRLCKYNSKLNEEKLSDSPIYIWSINQVTHTISEKQLVNIISGSLDAWVDSLKSDCKEIIESRKTVVILTGEGAEIQGLDQFLRRRLGCEVRRYIPETLGARNPALASCLGLFYACKDQQEITGMMDSSINMKEFMKTIEYDSRIPGKQESVDNTISGRIKSILRNSKD